MEIDQEEVKKLIQKHFTDILISFGYIYTEKLVIIQDIYCSYEFTYISTNRKVVISIDNNDEYLKHHLYCVVTIFKLPYAKEYENRMDPEYFYYITKKENVDDEKYKIDQNNDYIEELDRVMNNYTKLIFNGQLIEVIEGKLWFENIHVPRD